MGTKVNASKLTALQPGVTTVAQVESEFGAPTESGRNSNGGTVLTYAYTHAQASASSFIPIVGAFAGHTDTKNQTVTLTFDSAGRLMSYSTQHGAERAQLFHVSSTTKN